MGKLKRILSVLLVIGILLPSVNNVKADEINEEEATKVESEEEINEDKQEEAIINEGNEAAAFTESASVEKPTLVNKSSNTLWVEGKNSANSNLELIKWHNKSSEGKYYLFLPSNIDTSNLRIWHSFSSDPVVNGVTLKNGEYTSVFSNKGSYTVKVGSSSYELKVMKSENIPALFIQTSSGSMSKVHADKNYDKESGKLLLVSEDGTTTNVEIDTIKGRGNSSWDAGTKLFGKYPYNLKLTKKTDLLNMGKSKKWVLLANCMDQSLMRNVIVYNYAKEVGLKYTPEIRSVDLYCNGSYYGNYQLCEKVEIDSNRVDIADLEKETENCNLGSNGQPIDLSKLSRGGSTSGTSYGTYKYVNVPNNPADITGGYLLEFDLPERYPSERAGFVTNRGQCVVIKSPENASKAQVEYIRKYVQEMEDAVYSSSGYNSKGKHYTEYIDLETAAKMYLVQEGFMNNDGNSTSFYLSKDRGQKIELSPVWDFDWALGGRTNSNLSNPSAWVIKNKKIFGGKELCLMGKLCTHSEFNEEVSKLWCTGMSDALKVVTGQKTSNDYKNLKTIDNCYNELHASANMNFKKYNMLGDASWGSAYTGSTFTENYQYVKNFMKKRVEFFDNNFKYEPKELTIDSIDTSKASPVSIGKSIDITATVKGGQGVNTYKYYINDELVSEDSKYTWTPKEIGEYRIKVVVTDKALEQATKEITFTIKEVSNNIVTIYYKNSSFTNVNMYYKIGSGLWTALPGEPMEKSSLYDGFFENTVDLGDEETLTACFNNGNNSWDNNNKQNYTFEKGSYKLENGVITKIEDEELKISKFYITNNDVVTTNSNVNLVAESKGGIGTKTYKFYLEDGTVISEDTKNSIDWIPTKAGSYKINVEVKDAKGSIVTSSLNLDVFDGITIKEFTSDYNNQIKSGTIMNFNVIAEGGSGELKYKFILDNATTIKDTNESSLEWLALNPGSHSITVYVYDEKGISAKSEKTFTIYNELSFESLIASVDTCNVSDSVKFVAKADGGKSPLNYKFILDDNTILYEGENNYFNWSPEKEGDYKITVIITDSDLSTVSGEINYKVNEKPNNTVTVYYSGYDNPNIYYKIGSGKWTSSPGVAMKKSSSMNGYYEITIDLGDESTLTACFNDGNGNWDNNSKKNYVFNTGIYSVKDKVVTDLTNKDLEISSLEVTPSNSQTIGKDVNIHAEALYGEGDYEYKFTAKIDDKEILIQDYSNLNEVSWTPDVIGEYTIKAYVKDAAGKEAYKEMTYVVKEVSKNTVTVYYNKYSNPYIYYKIGNGSWTSSPGVKMEESESLEGFYEFTIDLGEESTLTACFNNGKGTWDNNNKQNYKFTEGTYKIEDGKVTKLS